MGRPLERGSDAESAADRRPRGRPVVAVRRRRRPVARPLALSLALFALAAGGEGAWLRAFATAEAAVEGASWEDARRAHQRALALAIEEEVPTPDLVEALRKLADRYVDRRRHGDARAVLEDAHARAVRSSGEADLSAVRILANLASLAREQGEPAEAGMLASRAYALAHERPIPDLPTMGQALNTLANVESDRGGHEKAVALYRRSLALLEDALGAEHRDVAAARANLGSAHLELGRPERALPLLTRALEVYEAEYGAEDLRTAGLVEDLGYAHASLGESGEAIRWYERALTTLERLHPGDPVLVSTMNNLGNLYRRERRYEEAERVYGRALAILEGSRAVDDPAIATNAYYLGVVAYERRDDARARDLFLRSLRIWQRSSPDEPRIQQVRALISELGPGDEGTLPPVGASP